MSTTPMIIGEHDVVALRNSVEGWPAGTKGAVVAIFPSDMWVEVVNESGDIFDLVFVPPEQLDLVRKWSTSTPEEAVD